MSVGAMRVVSVNAGAPEELRWGGRTYRTAIVKRPLAGPVEVGLEGLGPDAQADLRVHGGPDQAVYLYPREHYPFWEEMLGEALPETGALGENLTTLGVLESEWSVGDELRVGGVAMVVTQPRLPCEKLAARYARADLPDRFVQAVRPGLYCRVREAGQLSAGDVIARGDRHPEGWSVATVFRAMTTGEVARGVRLRLACLDVLPDRARRRLGRGHDFVGTIRPAAVREAASLNDLLTGAGLPLDGLPEDAAVILVAVDQGGQGARTIVGGVAVELHGDAALLRSAVVSPERRGRGLGAALVQAATARARGLGAATLSLLTETAPDFFAGLGFRPVDRGELPSPLRASRELQGVCPESARCFVRELASRPDS